MPRQHRKQTALYLRIRVLAREMRKQATPAEDYFWEKVRGRRLYGLKINRQFIIACQITPDFFKYYIADFHCHAHKLIIELDGQIHLKQSEQDLMRTEHLRQYGYRVLRFSNEEVMGKWELVAKQIWEVTRGTHPRPLS